MKREAETLSVTEDCNILNADNLETKNSFSIISECSKLAKRKILKKWKNRLDWVGIVVHWEFCKWLASDQVNQWSCYREWKSSNSIGSWN